MPDGETIFVGIDMHQRQWRVTIRTGEVELTSAGIPGDWQSLRHSLERYRGHPVEVIYEAGSFGYWLHDQLVEFGAQCIVTPSSLIPQESGNRVKTDKRDSRMLALLLGKGMLKQVYVPTPQDCSDDVGSCRHRRSTPGILLDTRACFIDVAKNFCVPNILRQMGNLRHN